MVKVHWSTAMENPAARTFREPDRAPGIVFHYRAAYTSLAEARKCCTKIKQAGMKYRIQNRTHCPANGKCYPVHVVFEGRPKGR